MEMKMDINRASYELARELQTRLPLRAAEDGPGHVIVRYATGLHERLSHSEARALLR
jgi:hypothetical protein